ncbi:MAG: NfeD family protein [Tepidimonas sp.]|uniref:NfeD family protein n=1 Tax=Tepidimonas sp. TaxID=2002775 RepID=UPI00298F2950|nr:NfeD family protein [Tepidimonas sp.]MDW8337327.1 NfeD family protein [Tepidimonas sp.]
MDDATLWWVLVGLLVAAELTSGTFFLLMLALAAAGGAVAAHAGWTFSAQLVTAGLCALLTVGGWSWVRLRRRTSSQGNPDVVLDIGQTVDVPHWQADGTARVRYRGTEWLAIAADATVPLRSGPHRIRAVQGNRLVIEPLQA